MDFAPPRGTQDLLPPVSERMRALYEAAHRVAARHGYRYVETPGFESTDLFRRTSGETSDVVRKEQYTFEDRGGRTLTLRPEGTAPIVRAYLDNTHDLPAPFKAYAVETLYRYGRPQAGRLREYRTLDVEVIGEAAPEADVEVVAVAVAYLAEVGVTRYELQLNSLGDGACRPAYRQALITYLRGRAGELTDEHRERFEENPLRVLDCKDEACMKVAAGAPKMLDRLCGPCREHFDSVRHGLDREAISYVITPTLARGLDYYTRTAFELVGRDLSRSQGTIVGGGRYDGLAEILGGPPTPGVGFGMGLERVLLALEAEGAEPPAAAHLDAYVVAVGPGAVEPARVILREIRTCASADMSLVSRSLKSQLRAADRLGARFAVIIGAGEIASHTVSLKRLSDGVQQGFVDVKQALRVIIGKDDP